MGAEKLKNSLIDFFDFTMIQYGNTDYSIENIKIFEEDDQIYAFADIKFVWYMNIWDKQIEMKDVLFVLSKFLCFGEWKSPLFL